MALKRKPQLSDREVALIKAMLNTNKYKRQEILTYFSRKDRPVNLGRISEIATNKKRVEVAPASNQELSEFLRASEANEIIVKDDDPICHERLKGFLDLKRKKPITLNAQESNTLEFKRSFCWKNRAGYSKTISGFANNKGGYILFGVENDGRVVGLDANSEFEKIDHSKITQFLNSCFQPQIIWKRCTHKIGSKTIGIIWTAPCERKPVICSKTTHNTKEGDIYFRYIGETKTIAYAELAAILHERDTQSEKRLATKISRIAEFGSDNLGLLDTYSGVLDSPAGEFMIDESLLHKIAFIQEGSFSEKKGSPALKIIGDVQPINSNATIITKTRKTALTIYDVLNDFLNQSAPDDPESYIRQIVHDQAIYLPVFYFMHLSNLSASQAIKIIEGESTSREGHRKKLINRIRARKGHPIAPGPSTTPYRKKYLAGQKFILHEAENRTHAVRAIQTLNKDEIRTEYCLKILRDALICYNDDPDQSFMSEIRFSASHVDAIIFGAQVSAK